MVRLLREQRTYKALTILQDNPHITAARFAELYFTEEKYQYLFTAVSNQGEGTCAGKKAWLCAGSLLGSLAKRNFVAAVPYINPKRFYLRENGKMAIQNYENKKNR